MEDIKIDRRTKEYKESIRNPEILNESLEPSPEEVPKAVKLLESCGAKVLTPGQPGADLLHCIKCGKELNEGERNSTSRAHCRDCIWENEGKKVGKSVREKLEEAERNGL